MELFNVHRSPPGRARQDWDTGDSRSAPAPDHVVNTNTVLTQSTGTHIHVARSGRPIPTFDISRRLQLGNFAPVFSAGY